MWALANKCIEHSMHLLANAHVITYKETAYGTGR